MADRALPLFAAADRNGPQRPELAEPGVRLAPMPVGGEVVQDYRSTGLSLHGHPVAFLRNWLRASGMATCAEAAAGRDNARVAVPGLVLMRQKLGSAKGVMFITLEDETGIANLVIWPSLFERHRSLVLSAGIMAARGRVQREGEVVHLVADELTDLTALLRGVG